MGTRKKESITLREATVRFAGDSGDGIQVMGTRFADTMALSGNDVRAFPGYPAEIRAPAGTLYGVSAFQVHFSSEDIHTPGDDADVLVVMNPEALKKNLKGLIPNALIIVNMDSFDSKNLKLAVFESNPLEGDTLADYQVFQVPSTKLNYNALKDSS